MIIRHEINILTGTLVHTSTSSSTAASEIATIDKPNFSGSVTGFLEIVYTNTSTNTATVQIIGGGANQVTLAASQATFAVAQSTPGTFSNSFGRIQVNQLASAGTVTIKSAKFIVLQDTGSDPLTATQQQYEIGNRETAKVNTAVAALTLPKYWKYNSANFDGTKTFYAEITWQYTGTGNGTVKLQTSSNLTTPSWSDVVTIVSAGTAASATTVRSTSFTPVDGNIYRIVTNNSSSMGSLSIYNAKIIVQQTDATEITKFEEQYLLANTALAAGTALQTFLTKWDSAEWDGVTNTYVHQVEASDGNTSTVEVETAAGVQVANSVVSSPDNIGDSNFIDRNLTQNSGGTTLALDSAAEFVAQSFTGNGQALKSVILKLSKNNSPTGNITVKIYAHSGTFGTSSIPTGSVLATSDNFDVSTLPAGAVETNVLFNFSGANQIVLTNTTKYCLVINYSAGTTAGNSLNIYANTSSVHGGNYATSPDGTTYTPNSSIDLYFIVIGTTNMTMPANGNLDVKATTNSGSLYASRIVVVVVKTVNTNQTAVPGVGVLTVTGFSPTINITQSVPTALGQLTLTGFAPILNSKILIGLGQLTLTGFEPTIAITSNQSVTTELGALTLTGFEPTIAITSNQSVTTELGALILAGFTPILKSNIDIGLGALIVTGFEPTIAITSNQSVTTGLGALIVAGFAPVLNNSTLIGLGQLTITGFEPTINITQSAQTLTGQLNIVGFEPTILISVVAAPGVGQLTLTGFAPVLNNSTLIGLGQLIITGFEPTINITQSATTGVGALTLVGFNPILNNSILVGLGTLIVTGFEPTVNITQSVIPGTGQLTLLGFASSLNAGIQTGSGNLIVTGYSPTVNITQSAAPGVGQLTITGFAPNLKSNINIGLGVLIITGLNPTVNITQSVTPGVGQIIVTGFEPTIANSNSQVAGTNTGQLIATGYISTVNITQSTAPGVGQLIVIGYEPSAGSSQSVQTLTGQLIITSFEPTVNVSQSALTSVGQLIITGFEPAPTSSAGVVVGTNTGEMIVTGYLPTVNITISVNTDIGELIIIGLPPTITIGSAFYEPSTGEIIISGYRPTISIAKNIIIKSYIDSELVVKSYIKSELKIKSEIDNHLTINCAST
jgi:hypothetical protein